jgi:peptidyl-Lys metalloendopeptidase
MNVPLHRFTSAGLATALLMFSAATLSQQNGISVSLSSDATSLNGTDDVTVNVQMTNFSPEPVYVLKWLTPSEQASAGVFTVTRNGEPVSYLGPLVKRGSFTADDFVKFAAGSSLTFKVELSSLYDLSASGVYNIQYDVKSMHTYRLTALNAASTAVGQRPATQSQDLASNTIALTITGNTSTAARIAANEAGSRAPITAAPSFAPSVSAVGCSNTRLGQISTALSSAETYAANSVSYLNAGTRGPRYTSWFGAYTASRYSTVRSHFANISNAASTQPLVFDCSTCPAGPNANAFAYVFANQPYRIYLCNAFWAAPNTGTDSRAGTIVHELSHFTVLAGTSDFAYGQSAARNLAISNPTRAVSNADSHEYFSENTPRQN